MLISAIRPEWIWTTLVGCGRMRSDAVGFGRIWSDSVGFGRGSPLGGTSIDAVLWVRWLGRASVLGWWYPEKTQFLSN